VVDDISHEGLRVLLREEGVSFQVIKTWKQSTDPDFEAKKNRILELYAIADGTAQPGETDPTVVICMDEFGPSTSSPTPASSGPRWPRAEAMRPFPVADVVEPPTPGRTGSGTSWPATTSQPTASTGTSPRPRAGPSSWPSSATSAPSIRPRSGSPSCPTTSAHTSTTTDQRVAIWAEANNVELAYTPTYSSWLNRIEAQFQALRYFAFDGTDHASHKEQASVIRRYVIWRNRNAHDRALRELVKRANVA
jgi:hypothetical protein